MAQGMIIWLLLVMAAIAGAVCVWLLLRGRRSTPGRATRRRSGCSWPRGGADPDCAAAGECGPGAR
jgi:hypothetical protein